MKRFARAWGPTARHARSRVSSPSAPASPSELLSDGRARASLSSSFFDSCARELRCAASSCSNRTMPTTTGGTRWRGSRLCFSCALPRPQPSSGPPFPPSPPLPPGSSCMRRTATLSEASAPEPPDAANALATASRCAELAEAMRLRITAVLPVSLSSAGASFCAASVFPVQRSDLAGGGISIESTTWTALWKVARQNPSGPRSTSSSSPRKSSMNRSSETTAGSCERISA
mmetsp:Transcript_22155/g.50021  ORF Transcript_22155/g.50021 Transcript_22155/m.50021 type:complete len:231 (-) Transcript_22155:873-1565(-)